MKTTTKEKTATSFDASAIEFAVDSSIKKNTLPEIRGSWKNWLDSYNAAELETDQDFLDAAKFVKSCELTEDKFDELEDKAIKGDVSKVIAEIRSMKETTRSKRLEFSRSIDQRKDKLKRDAVAAALKQLDEGLAGFEHRKEPRNMAEEPERMLLVAIKGKSSITMMQKALEQESARITADAKAYSDTFTAMLVKVYGLYEAAGETATDSELYLLVSKYYTDAPERANLILQQKKVAREQAEIESRRLEEEDKATKISTPFAAILPAEPALPAASAPKVSEPATAQAPAMIFTAVFHTNRPIKVAADLTALGAQDVTFEEAK